MRKSLGMSLACLVGVAGVLGGCGGSKMHKSADAFVLQPYEQLNLAVSGTQAELLVENKGTGQVAMRVPTDEASIEPSGAYTVAIDGSVIVELYNASRVPTQVRWIGSSKTPVTISPLR